jgi:DHA1 family multidrug resistance protein-like MFS transporter
MPPSFLRVFLPFYSSGFTWNLALGMTQLLIPLYASHLGFSGVAIGSLIALPILVQIIFNLLGGAWTDRLGGMVISQAAFVATIVAGVVFAYSSSFAGLLFANVILIVARAMYWPSSWSLASQLPGAHNESIGWLNAITSLGQIAGSVIAGIIIAYWGFQAGFWTIAAMGLLSFAIGLTFQYKPASPRKRPPPMLATYRMLLRQRAIYYGVMCAYVSALPFSLSVSFYPILLVEQGFNSELAGWLVGMRAAGAIASGMLLARFVRRADGSATPLVSALVVAASVALVALFHDPLVIALFLLGVGLGSGIMTIYFQVLVSSISSSEYRGSAMALAGMGWSVSHITTPLIMGWLKDLFGIQTAFYIFGGFAFLYSFALLPVQRWAGLGRAGHGPAVKT